MPKIKYVDINLNFLPDKINFWKFHILLEETSEFIMKMCVSKILKYIAIEKSHQIIILE